MSKTPFRIKFISLLMIISFILTFTTSSVVAALADEKVEISLSAAAPRKSVALVPSFDYPSVTINSENPVDILWRQSNNALSDEFNIESSANVSYEYPFHIKRSFSPLTDQNNIDYGKTSWLIFNSTSSESHGDYTISTNNSAQAIDDNGEEIFFVQPDNNFHLRIAVGVVGPISVRMNFFPDKGTNYFNYNLFDPNGAIIEPYEFDDGDDEYLCFIAEKKGSYSLIFNPINEPHFYNIKCSTYKPETLRIEDTIKPTIVGLPDSELTDAIKKNAFLTLDWYKFNPAEGQTTRVYFEPLRGIPGPVTPTQFFGPGLNNTVAISRLDQVDVSTSLESKRPNYILVRHDGTARYLIGLEDLEPQAVELETYIYSKLAADMYKVLTFSVNSISSMRIDLFSEDSDVVVTDIINKDGFSSPTQTFSDAASEYKAYNFVAMPGEYILIVHNTINEEVWMNLRVTLNNLEENLEFSDWEDMETDPDSVNLTTDTDVFELSKTDIPFISKSRLFNIKSTFEDERLWWNIYWGAQYDDNNDLVASHGGQDIDVNIRLTLFEEVNGEIQHLEIINERAEISDSVNSEDFFEDIYPYRTISSETGNFWIALDSYMDNNTDYLPYENYLRLGVYDVQDFYYNFDHGANFTDNEASLTNVQINTTRYPDGAIVKVPAAGYDWTEVEVHTLNGTMDNGIRMYVDIPNILSSAVEHVLLIFNLKEDPILSNPDQLGNYTTGYGAPTNQDYIYLALLLEPSNGREVVTFNLTLQRLPTSILTLEKETKVGGRAPGFEWIFSIFGLGTVVYIIRNKKKKF